MKVSVYANPVRSKSNNTVAFGRKLKEQEKPEYSKAIHDALEYLEVKNLSMIVHGSSFPSAKRDSAIGSPYSKGADKFVDFLKLNGFNSIQLGPGGTIGKKDNSPYIAKVFAKNELFIDLEPLKSDKYANILSEKTYNALTTENKLTKDRNHNYTDFDKAFSNYDKAMTEAYGNFQQKLKANDKNALKLNKEFENFKKENASWVENDGLYKVLSKENGSDDYTKWSNDVDKDLPQGLKDGNEAAKARYAEIKKNHSAEIDQNSFTQFIADKQLKDNTNHRKEIGFNYIGDLLVGFSQSDVWANQNAFMKGWKLGCPFGGVHNGPQTWGIPVLDPKKFFNEDGTLGESGKVLKEKIAYSLKNYDNVRIDHALGLVDPYVYREDSVVKYPDGSVDRNRLVANNVSYMHDVDPNGNFKRVLKDIVLPTFKEYGVDKNQAVWEDLGSSTGTFDYVYRQQEQLPGISQTEWARAENAPRRNWSLVGSHDSQPASVMINNNGTRYSDAWNVDYLSGYLNPDPAKGAERWEYKNKIINSPQEHVKAKFTELFRGTENLQMMFVDFFGIDKVYNYGGQDRPTNWKLRVDNDFEDDYYKALQDEKSFALNMPEILAQAVKAKASMAVAKTQDPNKADQLRNELDAKLNPLLSKLDSFKNILKEKEETHTSQKVQTPATATTAAMPEAQTEIKTESTNAEQQTSVAKDSTPEQPKTEQKPVEKEEKVSDTTPVSTNKTDKTKNSKKSEEVTSYYDEKNKKKETSVATYVGAVLSLAVIGTAITKIVNKIKAKIAERRQAKAEG